MTAAFADGTRTFDLEAAYQSYPRKQGKSAGMKKLAREIKTPEDYAALLGAISHYSRSRDVQRGFVKLFSTFAGEWRDWTDPAAGTSLVAAPAPGFGASSQEKADHMAAQTEMLVTLAREGKLG